jgi:hypothetical protein
MAGERDVSWFNLPCSLGVSIARQVVVHVVLVMCSWDSQPEVTLVGPCQCIPAVDAVVHLQEHP